MPKSTHGICSKIKKNKTEFSITFKKGPIQRGSFLKLRSNPFQNKLLSAIRFTHKKMDLQTSLILALGIGIGFFAQTVFGFAATLIAFPILMIVLSLQESIALTSIFLLLFSGILVYQNRKLMNKKIVLEMGIGGIIGLVIGVQILKLGNPEILNKLLGVFIVLYASYSFIKKREIKIFNNLGFLFSFLGGFFSGLFSSGGPLFITYIYNKIEKANVVRATLIGILGIINVLRVPLLIQSGMLNRETMIQAIVLLPIFLISLYLGNKFYKKMDEKIFKQLFIVLLLIMGISLIVK